MANHAAPKADTPVVKPDSTRIDSKPAKRKHDWRIHTSTARILLYALVIGAFAFTFAFTKAWGESMDRVEALWPRAGPAL